MVEGGEENCPLPIPAPPAVTALEDDVFPEFIDDELAVPDFVTDFGRVMLSLGIVVGQAAVVLPAPLAFSAPPPGVGFGGILEPRGADLTRGRKNMNRARNR